MDYIIVNGKRHHPEREVTSKCFKARSTFDRFTTR
jgi:hypothetical protein